ncbi:MAG: 2-oxo acid dehydrogenase subunit E2 [Thermoleophilaceae bacterium]|nr:2-oxo acid dehydrogenase subunit E2 [Thermoleophilaceae bacterium]
MSSSPTSAATVEVTMPQMGVSVAEGTVVEWRKRVGDWVEADEAIVDISTDKIDSEVPSPAAGRLVEILVEPGVTVDVGTPLARLDTGARPGEPHTDEHAPATRTAGAQPSGAEAPPPGPGAGDAHAPPVSPVVRRIAAEHGIDLSQIEGTGRLGRVTKRDVLAFLARPGEGAAAPPQAPLHTESPYREEPQPTDAAGPPSGEPLSIMRRQIGEHMRRSLDTAAHCTTIVEADMSRIEAARRAGGKRLTYLPFVARAAIAALREYPTLNATLEGDRLTVHEAVHLGIAVSLGEDGLIVPVVRDAHELSHEGLAARIEDLAERARERRLRPDEVRGGTFTITNPGAYGALLATPIINQPQVAILDLEAVVRRPVAVDGDSIAVRPMTYLCMSWDHRALDGALAAQFLSAVRRHIEEWSG